MIIYQNKKLIECGDTDCVGIAGDNAAYTQDFYIKGVSDDSISYTLHLRFADGSVNSITPDLVRTDGEGTGISWIVKKNDIFMHGYFELQIEGRNSTGLIFQTEIVRLSADESLPVEDKEYENPNSATLRLREEAYDALETLSSQQEELDENFKRLEQTDVSKKVTSSDLLDVVPSRNLLNLPDYSAVKNGVTVEVKDNKITLAGTSTAYTEFYINLPEVKTLKADNTYTLSLHNLTASNASVFYIYHLRTDSETSDTNLVSLSSANAVDGNTASYTPTDDITASYVKIAIASGRVTDSVFYAQLEIGDTASEYHSPTIPESVTIKNSYFEKLNAVRMNYIYVSRSYSFLDEGYGVTKFNTIYDANESIKDNGYYNRYTIVVKSGTYTDLQERYSGISDSGETELKGICTKDYVYYEAENIYSMGSVVIKWDGATGFDTLTRADIVLKCPFHIRPNTHTHIRGFTFNTKNLRYGIHVETGGKGYLSDWKIDNCRFIWGGNPDCTDYATNTNVPVFGCGHSIGEKGVISNCKIVATNCSIGYQNHENKDYSGKNLAVKSGADITIKNCDFGGTKIQCRTLYGKVSDTPGQVTVDNCINISSIENLYSGESTEPWWIITQK